MVTIVDRSTATMVTMTMTPTMTMMNIIVSGSTKRHPRQIA
jgi:hypothetical protein